MKLSNFLILAMALGSALGVAAENKGNGNEQGNGNAFANGQNNGNGNVSQSENMILPFVLPNMLSLNFFRRCILKQLQGNEKEVSFTTKGVPVAAAGQDFASVTGEMEDIDVLSDLINRKTFKLRGLKQNPNAPVVFKVVSASVEQVSTGGADADTQPAGAESGTTTVTFWHGVEAGRRDRTISLIAAADGSIMGSCTDGEITYLIQSEDADSSVPSGKKKLKYWAAEIKDLPEEAHAEDETDFVNDGSRRALRGAEEDAPSLRGRSMQSCPSLRCGVDWASAQSQCGVDCTSQPGSGWGGPSVCPSGQKCFADIACCNGGPAPAPTQTTIRIRTVFTSLTYSILGSTGCTNYHALAISQVNQFLAASNSNVRFENAGWATTGFEDISGSSSGKYLTALKTEGDYWMDGTITSQTTYNIDVVVVVGEHVLSGRASNVGSTRYGPSPYKYGYAEVKRTLGTLSDQWTYAHELGHIIGGCHDYDSNCATANHGNVYEQWCDRSIMAYPNCPSTCSSCPRYGEFTAGRSYDEGYNNAYYMNNFGPVIAGLF